MSDNQIVEDERFRLTPSRLRVRNEADSEWNDLCNSEMYVMDPETQSWTRLFPGKVSVRDGGNERWLPITCEFDPAYDDPCLTLGNSPDNCNGLANDPEAGSGNGVGSNGLPFDVSTGYPAGYDLPDSGHGGYAMFSLPKANASLSPTGLMIRRPVLNVEESYDMHGRSSSDNNPGKYDVPNVVGASTFGRGASVTETVYELADGAATYELLYAAYDQVSIDVYYMGIRRATTCGWVPGMTRSVLSFYIDPAEGQGEKRVMIRVRGVHDCKWAFQLIGPLADPISVGLDVHDSDDYAEIEENLFLEDSFVLTDYLGSPVFPATCHATVGNFNNTYPWQLSDRIVKQNFFEYYHYIGDAEGRMVIDFSSWDKNDLIEVFYDGNRIATSNEFTATQGYIEFLYVPVQGVHDIMVRVSTENLGRAEDLSTWYYTIYCPDAVGHRRNPWICECLEGEVFNCDENSVLSMGHPATEDNFNIDNNVARGAFRITFSNVSNDTLVRVFNQDGTLIVSKEGIHTFDLEAFNFDQDTNEVYKQIYVRVESPLGASWQYTVFCPEPLIDIEIDPIESGPMISINDTEVAEGGTGQLMITLDRAVDTDTSVRVRSYDMTAFEGTDYCGLDETVVVPAGLVEMPVTVEASPCSGSGGPVTCDRAVRILMGESSDPLGAAGSVIAGAKEGSLLIGEVKGKRFALYNGYQETNNGATVMQPHATASGWWKVTYNSLKWLYEGVANPKTLVIHTNDLTLKPNDNSADDVNAYGRWMNFVLGQAGITDITFVSAQVYNTLNYDSTYYQNFDVVIPWLALNSTASALPTAKFWSDIETAAREGYSRFYTIYLWMGNAVAKPGVETFATNAYDIEYLDESDNTAIRFMGESLLVSEYSVEHGLHDTLQNALGDTLRPLQESQSGSARTQMLRIGSSWTPQGALFGAANGAEWYGKDCNSGGGGTASWETAVITQVVDTTTSTSDDCMAGIEIRRHDWEANGSNGYVAVANSSTPKDVVQVDTSKGPLSIIHDRHISKPAIAGIQDWRISLVEGEHADTVRLGEWNNVYSYLTTESLAGTGTQQRCVIKVEIRYTDGTILSQDIELISKSKYNPNSGSGGGCIRYGALVERSNGKTLPVEVVQVGDVFWGAKIKGLVNSDDPLKYFDWNTKNLEAEKVEVKVTGVSHARYDSYYFLNGRLPVTLEHPVLAKQQGVWQWLYPENVNVGDYLLNDDLEEELVRSNEYIRGNIHTVNFDVESEDTYFIEGMLVHNAGESNADEKEKN